MKLILPALICMLLCVGCQYRKITIDEKFLDKCGDSLNSPDYRVEFRALKKMLRDGASVNGENNNMAPLRLAVMTGNYRLIAFLMDNGAARADDVLEHACKLECMSILLDRGFSPNVKDRQGRSQVYYHAAEPKLCPSFELLLRWPVDSNAVDYRGYTPLHIACWKSDLETVKKLLEYNAKVNVSSYRGYTPLHMAVARKNADIEIVKLLLENGADINAVDVDGNTVLHCAKWHNNEKIIKILLEKGANPATLNKLSESYKNAVVPKINNVEIMGIL